MRARARERSTYIPAVIIVGHGRDRIHLPLRTDNIPLNIGVIVNEDYVSNIVDFFNKAVAILESKNGLNSYSLNPQIDPQRRGCGTGDSRFDGAYLATEFYYNDHVSAFFGPVCQDGEFRN